MKIFFSIITFVALLYSASCSCADWVEQVHEDQIATLNFVPKTFDTPFNSTETIYPILDLQYEKYFNNYFSFMVKGNYWNASADRCGLTSDGITGGFKMYTYQNAPNGFYLLLCYLYQDINIHADNLGTKNDTISAFASGLGYQWIFDHQWSIDLLMISAGNQNIQSNYSFPGGVNSFTVEFRLGLGYAWTKTTHHYE